MMGGAIVVKCTVNYEIMYFPLMTLKHIKVPVHTLPTKQRASLKWACHAGNGTYKSRGVCSVAVQIKTILYIATLLEYSMKVVFTTEL